MNDLPHGAALVTYRQAPLGAQAAGRSMITRRGGSIILIASMSDLIANRPQKQTAYNVSKAGVIVC